MKKSGAIKGAVVTTKKRRGAAGEKKRPSRGREGVSSEEPRGLENPETDGRRARECFSRWKKTNSLSAFSFFLAHLLSSTRFNS